MSCASCFGTGTVMARSLERPRDAPYAFRCNCGNATKRNYPYWDSSKLKSFEVLWQQSSGITPGPNRPTLAPPRLKEMPK